VLLASGAAVSQAILAETYCYATTLAAVAAIVMFSATVVIALGRERKCRNLNDG